jgi:hypothetical protein
VLHRAHTPSSLAPGSTDCHNWLLLRSCRGGSKVRHVGLVEWDDVSSPFQVSRRDLLPHVTRQHLGAPRGIGPRALPFDDKLGDRACRLEFIRQNWNQIRSHRSARGHGRQHGRGDGCCGCRWRGPGFAVCDVPLRRQLRPSVYAAYTGRFALVKPVDPGNPAIAETVAEWAATKGTVGIRLFLVPAVSADPAETGLNRVLAAAARHSAPVNIACPGAHGIVAKATLVAHLVAALAGNAESATNLP